jgi:hypothetical protein
MNPNLFWGVLAVVVSFLAVYFAVRIVYFRRDQKKKE